ncbi:MAG: hypothetical protein ACI8RA_002780 [Chlamydiales bacterium]|jgi:hypothetical protein
MTTLPSLAYHNSSQIYQEFSKCVPRNTVNAACKSALYTFTATSILSASPSLACAYAVVAALSALVDSAITPFFSHVCCSEENPSSIKWYESIAKRFLTLSLVQAATGFNVSSLWAITNLFFVSIDRDRNTTNDITPPYLLFPV